MKEFRKSKRLFIIEMILGAILLCPTFGLWGFVMLAQIIDYMTTSLIIGPKSIVFKKGFFSVSTNEIRYNKINSVSIKRSWNKKFGTIIIYSGNDILGLEFKNIENPEEVKREIDNKIEENS